MPHAVDDGHDVTEEETLALLNDPTAFELLQNEPFEAGEKADDAEDYEDISDDDLPDEENAAPTQIDIAQDTTARPAAARDGAKGGEEEDKYEDDVDMDDLFGENDKATPPHSPQAEDSTNRAHEDNLVSNFDGLDSSAPYEDQAASSPKTEIFAGVEDDISDDEQFRQQMELFAQSRRTVEGTRPTEAASEALPAPPADSELFSILFPQFEAEKPPRFGHLFPGKRAQYIGKTPLKAPKPVHPTKVNLDIEPDLEKDFRLPSIAFNTFQQLKSRAQSKGCVLTQDSELAESESDDADVESPASEDLDDLKGYKWQDLIAVCQDWAIPGSPISESELDAVPIDDDMDIGSEFDALFGDEVSTVQRGKKRKSLHDLPLKAMHGFTNTFENPEHETAQLSKKVRIDMNDPLLLVESVAHRELKSTITDVSSEREKKTGSTQGLFRRYNISNDEAYDMLKENRQNKIRGTLGSQAIEHAMPAARLQYPFYKIRLSAREARSFHRPSFAPEPGLVHFEKLRHIKRKHIKGMGPHTVFATSEDLSQGDNSNVLLLEYSEEYPMMMSDFGMGNRLINYYRRKDENDTNRPKLDIGETEILLPQDKSPFSIFGNVDAGQTVPTISNGMYRAPVFRHNFNDQDFLLISNRTGVNGRKWHLKNMENLHVVGQQFPSVEVPGTHSRKVTDASKKRLRMLSYRLYRRKGKLKNEMIMQHIPGSDVAQNRSKMREFMNYDKDRGWLPRETDVPEEATVRSWIKPEDVCLLDSMQVGDQQLQDAGYNKGAEAIDEEDEDKQGQSIDEQLAPWYTTKNFLNACQGKAMLQLHGEGDPTGRGEAFNFIKTSMKGGFKEIGESVQERLNGSKENGGHSYNVAKQQKKYNDTIRRIWDAQCSSLSSTAEHDIDMEDAEEAGIDDRGRTPNSALPGRANLDDETASILSKTSTGSQGGRVLRIVRRIPEKNGRVTETVEIVRDPKVIREYLRRRRQTEINNKSIGDLKFTGNAEHDEAASRRLQDELDRLYRNRERREAREKAKGVGGAASPEGDAPSPSAEGTPTSSKKKHVPGGTQRKCANCGQVGHIKTNKKLCPLLNGTVKQDQGFGDNAFGAISTPVVEDTPAPPSAGFG